MKNCLKVCLIVVVNALFATSVFAQVSISDGGASYVWTPGTTGSTFSDTNSGNVLFEDRWMVQYDDGSGIGTSTLVEALDSQVDDGSDIDFLGTVNSGNTATSTWQINGEGGAGTHLYEVSIIHTIRESSGGVATLEYDVTFTTIAAFPNSQPGSTVKIWYYSDNDLGSSFLDDSADGQLSGGDGLVQIGDVSGSPINVYHHGFGADGFEVRNAADPGSLEGDILGGGYDLSNGGGPLTGVDVRMALQWNLTAPGQGNSVTINGLVTIPEPGSLAFLGVLALAGTGFVRRRRR